jgi:uncharacterized membrane protein YsdA (DUF1294 family)
VSTLLRAVLIAVAVVNAVTFLAFGLDKMLAKRDARRLPESWLLLLSFATGLVGGWLGMSVFRHKTRKTSFRVKMVAVSVLNVAWLLVWLGIRGDLS